MRESKTQHQLQPFLRLTGFERITTPFSKWFDSTVGYMIKTTVSKRHKDIYYSDVQFCLMEGGHSETRNIDKTTNPTKYSWTIADELKDGGILIRVMTPEEYKKYKHAN